MASFAKAQLLKYGWTEGKGLGKYENGIVDPLKPKLKFDATGVGHDCREHKWWELVYDKAASNVQVDTESRDVKVGVKDKDAVEITTRKLDLRKLRKKHNLEYGSFLKTCTLDNGKVLPETSLCRSTLDELLHEAPSFELTDEQLFEACGGRTAHKGARHGLTLSGKLARIAQQEAELLGSPKISASAEWTEVKKKKKLKRKRRRSAAEIDLDVGNLDNTPRTDANANTLGRAFSPCETPSQEVKKKSKNARRREKRHVEDLVQKLNSVVIVDDSREDEKSTGKYKQKKKRNDASEDTSVKTERERSTKRMKRKNREINDGEGDNNEKKKKSRLSSIIDVVLLSDSSLINLDGEDMKKMSKKHKKDYTETDKMNHRIEKKKKKHQTKTEKRRVERLSECLMAVNLCEDSVDSGRGEDLIESCETSRKFKKWKKHKKEKRDKKIEEIIILDP